MLAGSRGWEPGACEGIRLRERHVKGPEVKVSHIVKEVEGRPVCVVHRELGVQEKVLERF